MHAKVIQTNITTVIQKIIFVINYNFLCRFLCCYFSSFCCFASETEMDDGFTRYPKLISVSYMDHTVSLKLEPKSIFVLTNGSRSVLR